MTIERMAFEHIISKLDAQNSTISGLRSQASIAAAVIGLIATLFAGVLANVTQGVVIGSEFLKLNAPWILFIVACFGVSIALAVLVLVSWEEFNFSFDAKKMLENRLKYESDEEFYRDYVEDGEWFFRDNESRIEKAQNKLWWAVVIGWGQIVPWTALIGGIVSGR